ncbi:MAG: hypothetical protein P8Z30_19440 [Acidobacteriota bacterium]
MKNAIRSYPYSLFAAAFSLALGVLFLPAVARTQTISKTAKAGVYSVTLKVLPAESFTGTKAEMVRDGGAEPNTLKGPEHPNHHMVAFVKENGKPVENATVDISYRKLSPPAGAWKALPVVRMHVAGHGLATTHYGNNVRLAPGSYEVRVTVNGTMPASFRFTLKG